MLKSYLSLLMLAFTGLFTGSCTSELTQERSVEAPVLTALRADDLSAFQEVLIQLDLYTPEASEPFIADFGLFRTPAGKVDVGLGGVREYDLNRQLRGQDPWVDDPTLPLRAKEFSQELEISWHPDSAEEVERWLLEHFTGANGLDLRISTERKGKMILSARERPQIAEEVDVLDPIFFLAVALLPSGEE
ncbi:hypothetical protein [Lewinella sp. W8]|uniref:hypothetical protein n=1 Tax=Lewinella sp. W8 TaxID=2528208 RepID=UPI0010679DA6|nr:hypothetical protein [Lewinella sp. W8]MTB52392.1 hypothetical protein [Lewinella sp. W8]